MKCVICNKGTTRKDYCGSCNKVVKMLHKQLDELPTDQVCDCGKYKHEKARYCSSCTNMVSKI